MLSMNHLFSPYWGMVGVQQTTNGLFDKQLVICYDVINNVTW